MDICNCKICTESLEIRDMVFRKDTDTLIKKVQELYSRWSEDNSDRHYLNSILDGSWPNAIPILEAALENAKLKKEDKVEISRAIPLVINGRGFIYPGQEISYKQIVEQAFPNPSSKMDYIVTFSKGPSEMSSGTVVSGNSVRVKSGMQFTVAIQMAVKSTPD